MPSLLGSSSDGESSDSECSGEGALEEEPCEPSSQYSDEDKAGSDSEAGVAADVTGDGSDKSGDESEAGVAADVTGDESESGGMSPAQEVEEEAVETLPGHVRKHGQHHRSPRCRFMLHKEEGVQAVHVPMPCWIRRYVGGGSM